MGRFFLAAVVVGLAIGAIVAGWRAFDDNGESDKPAEVAPDSPESTVIAFAQAWSDNNIQTLYDLLTPESRAANPRQLFLQAYDEFETQTTLESIEVAPGRVSAGTAELAVHLSTGYFGELEYSTTLSLRQIGTRWMVEWERAAIHPDLGSGNRIDGIIEDATRASIFDRNGELLAVTRNVRYLGLNRSLVADRTALTATLVAFGFTKEQVDGAFDGPGGQTQRVTVGAVSDDRADTANLTLAPTPGVIIFFESERIHPLGPAAAHVVGYTRELTAEELRARAGEGFSVGDRIGATGLEAAMEEVLAGIDGATLEILDSRGNMVKTLFSQEKEEGQGITTTLDSSTLRTAYARLGGRAGAAVVIDPRTNAILAINSSPSFDPDAFERNDGPALTQITSAAGKPLTNRASTGLYSAGSTFKLVTGAAGLAFGGLTPGETLFCGATWAGIDPPRRNWEGTQGPLTIAQGLMRSCNSVFYEIGLRLYNNTEGKLSEMARAFGFGSPSGVVGLAEEDGLVPDAAWKRANRNEAWFPGDEVNLAIGQGDLLITPLQLANAYSSFINGKLRAPVLLAAEQAKERGALPLTQAQRDHLALGLRLVTSATGTASAAFANAGYTNFAGKSGTAEDAGEQQHVLFVAYAPATSPGAVAAVVLDDGQSGSIEAGPIARDLVLAALE